MGSWRNSTAGKVFVFHVVDPGLVLDTLCNLQNPLGVLPEQRASNEPSKQKWWCMELNFSLAYSHIFMWKILLSIKYIFGVSLIGLKQIHLKCMLFIFMRAIPIGAVGTGITPRDIGPSSISLTGQCLDPVLRFHRGLVKLGDTRATHIAQSHQGYILHCISELKWATALDLKCLGHQTFMHRI